MMLADSGKINSQSPEPPSVSGDELCTPQVVDVTRGFVVDGSQVVRKTSQLQRTTSWLQFPLNSATECGHSHRKPCRA
jgi:hypothetical protein